MKSLEENHVVVFASENFCTGNISSVNYFLGTDYQQDALFLQDVSIYYKETISKAIVECEDTNIAFTENMNIPLNVVKKN